MVMYQNLHYILRFILFCVVYYINIVDFNSIMEPENYLKNFNSFP